MELEMEDNKYTPKDICSNDTIYNIPIYQRLFAWGEENIEQLLNDLRNQFEKPEDAPYYIGMLTMHGNDLVDGQQRFTVLSIIGSVFQHYYPDWAGMKGKLHLSARYNDEIALQNLFDENPSQEALNNNMGKGQKTILNWIVEVEKEIDIEAFAKYVYEYCTFFIATLPGTYKPRDLNKYFEAMNSTGRNLESHEIVKVTKYLKSMSSEHNFYNAIWNIVSDMDKPLIRKRTEDGNKDTEDVLRNRYKSAIYDFDSNETSNLNTFLQKVLNDFTVSDGESDYKSIRELEADGHNPDVRRQDRYFGEGYHSMLSFPEFLLQILFILLPDDKRLDVNVNEFFDVHQLQTTVSTYTDRWKESEWKLFGREILRYRLIYDYYVIRTPNSEIGDYDLVYSETKESAADASVITQIQSYLFVDSSSKTYYRWIVPFLKYLKENKEIDSDDIFKELQAIDDDIDEHSKKFLAEEPSYSFGGRRTVYFLRRLDFYLWLSNHQLKNTNDVSYSIINNFKFKRSLNSQEHLHPQNDKGREGYEPWEDAKHKFGNLFLISSSFNSSQSDDTINTKFGRIKDQIEYSRIESIKLYLIFKLCGDEEGKWTKGMMEKHQEEMIGILRNSYLHDNNK